MSPETAGVIAAVVMMGALGVSSLDDTTLTKGRQVDTDPEFVADGPPKPVLPFSAEAAAVMGAQPPKAASPPRVAEKQMGAAFTERFAGPEMGKRWKVSDGWSNGDYMENDWRASQVTFIPEGMRITMAPPPEQSDKPLASGEIRTNEYFRYGYFEARMRAPRDPGLVIGFFTYAGRDEGKLPNEIDVEILGKNTKAVELTLHQGGDSTFKKVVLPFDAAEGFHTYGFDWQPGYVRWYIDGVMVHEETGGRVPKIVRPQQVMISLWSSKQLHEWVGELDFAGAPWKLDLSCTAYAPAYKGRQLCAG